MKYFGWGQAAVCLAAAACSAQVASGGDGGDSGNVADTGVPGDAGAGEASSRTCPPRTQIAIGAACAVAPNVTCPGPYGPAACVACELFALPCTCMSGTWTCDAQSTLQCNMQRCPMDSGVDTGGSRDAAIDG